MNLDAFQGLLQPIIMGIMLGGLYAVIASGLSLVFGVMKLINIAHGDFVIFGSYLALALVTTAGIDPLLGLLIVIPVMFGLGLLVEKVLISRVTRISLESTLIVTFGLSIIFQNYQQLVWSPLSRGLTPWYGLESFHLGVVTLPLVYVLDFVIGVAAILFLHMFLSKTYLGKAIRATSQDRTAAQMMGVNTKNVYIFAFALAMAFAGIAGVFVGLTFPFTPNSGLSFLIIAFGVVILGRAGSIVGTLVGGLIFGLSQTLGSHFFGLSGQMLAAYIIVLFILAVRPQGILGR